MFLFQLFLTYRYSEDSTAMQFSQNERYERLSTVIVTTDTTFATLSVRPSVRASLNFLKMGSLVFSILCMMIAEHDI